MILNLQFDPSTPLYLNVSSNGYQAGTHLIRVVQAPLFTGDSSGRMLFNKAFAINGYQTYKYGRKALKDWEKTMRLYEVFRDVGLDKFYTKVKGDQMKVVLRGLPGKRNFSGWTWRLAQNVPDKFKVRLSDWKNKAARKSWAFDGGLELLEWAADNVAAKMEGRSLTIEEQIRHGTEFASTAVAGTATIATAALLTGLAGTGVGVPVVVMLVVPYVAGSFFKALYSKGVEYQVERGNQNDNTARFIPDNELRTQVRVDRTHHSGCHRPNYSTYKPPLVMENGHHTMGLESAINDIHTWILTTSNFRDNAKKSFDKGLEIPK